MESAAPATKIKGYRPWTAVWLRPHSAIRQMLASGSDDFLHRLYMLWGISTIAFVMSQLWAGTEPHPVGVMIMFLLAGPIFGIIGGYVIAASVRKVGSLFGYPECSSLQMQLTISWTGLPYLTGNILFAVLYVAGTMKEIPALIPAAFAVNGVFKLYGLAVRTAGISAAMQMTTVSALMVYLVSMILILIPVTGVSLVYFYLMKGTFGL